MLVYNLLLLFVILLGFLLCEWKKSKRNDIVFLTVVSLTMIFIAAVRNESVGIDYPMYKAYFEQVRQGGWAFLISSANGYRVEPGFSLLNFIVSRFTGDIHVFMTVESVLCVTLTSVLVYKYSPIPWISMFVFASFGFYGNSLSFIRQTLAIAIYLFAVPYLMKKKFVPYLLIVILAALFHKSILVMILAYWISYLPVNWKTITAYLVGMGVVMAFSLQMFQFITKYIFTYYATDGAYYILVGRDWNTALIPVLTAVTAVILIKPLLRRNPANLVLINLSIFAAVLYIMTCQRFLFQRIAMMFYAAAILLIPEILKSIGADSKEADEYQQLKSEMKKQKSSQDKKKAFAESRKLKASLNTRKYIYYYSVAAVLFFGFLYNAFLLIANRINLTPYTTWL